MATLDVAIGSVWCNEEPVMIGVYVAPGCFFIETRSYEQAIGADRDFWGTLRFC